MSTASLAHVRQHSLHHRDPAEYVYVELPLYLFQRRLFKNTFVPISSIVHENVDLTYFAFKLRDRRTDCRGSVTSRSKAWARAGCSPSNANLASSLRAVPTTQCPDENRLSRKCFPQAGTGASNQNVAPRTRRHKRLHDRATIAAVGR
jgi:hypothetical protein